MLKAGATCIPCDPESSTGEILNFARAGNAAGIITSQAIVDDHPDLQERLREQGLTRFWTYDEVFELPDEQTEDERIALLPHKAHAECRIINLYFRHDGPTERRDAFASQPDEHGLDAFVSVRHEHKRRRFVSVAAASHV